MKIAALKVFTILWLLGMYVILLLAFAAAYQSPGKTVTISINMINEANFEFIVLLFALFVTTVGAFFLMIDIKNDYLSRVARKLAQPL
jgi:hypothetical protein